MSPTTLYNHPSTLACISSQEVCGRAQTLLSIFLSINFHNKSKVPYLLLYFNPSIASTMSQKEKEPPKRKITDEGRSFNEKWTDDYFLVKENSKALC